MNCISNLQSTHIRFGSRVGTWQLDLLSAVKHLYFFCRTGCLDVTARVRLRPLLLHPQPRPVLYRPFRPFWPLQLQRLGSGVYANCLSVCMSVHLSAMWYCVYTHVCVWLHVIVCVGLYMQLTCIVGILGHIILSHSLLAVPVHVCRSVVAIANSTLVPTTSR